MTRRKMTKVNTYELLGDEMKDANDVTNGFDSAIIIRFDKGDYFYKGFSGDVVIHVDKDQVGES